MSINCPYQDASSLPNVIPVFPLTRALLLPRGELPLNIFEPRYVAMIDDAIAGERIVGMVQPLPKQNGKETPRLYSIGCVGRITKFSEMGDGRYLIALTGVARFRIEKEIAAATSYRQCRVNYDEFHMDLEAGAGENEVDRKGMICMLRKFADSAQLEVDWASIDAAPNEALVNALSMMSPFGVDEKQALLEAADLKSRAEMLVALAELDLAQYGNNGPPLH